MKRILTLCALLVAVVAGCGRVSAVENTDPNPNYTMMRYKDVGNYSEMNLAYRQCLSIFPNATTDGLESCAIDQTHKNLPSADDIAFLKSMYKDFDPKTGSVCEAAAIVTIYGVVLPSAYTPTGYVDNQMPAYLIKDPRFKEGIRFVKTHREIIQDFVDAMGHNGGMPASSDLDMFYRACNQ